ncbi:Alpha/beta hydrolase fold-1 [Cynara cardunculus var. scolymus]|uniref:Alpha/beta hydrolase fold-1 n=1 Tax=Cynara cardunculus var. scolymus TaxID=59895 RepID=A0A118JZQ7_CYNCS|nr:Alpha/beta hydrolase fold-1 [Cynara cardunculus var. scolymus]
MATTSSSTCGFSKLHFPLIFTNNISSSTSGFHTRTRVSPIASKPNRIISVSSCLIDSSSVEAVESISSKVKVETCVWNWKGYSIRYQYAGNSGPALVLVHGFGANSDHWRKNIPVLAESHRVFSIDLIGYGYSDKPNPRLVGLQAAVTDPSICKGIVLLNISLRMLHITKQPWFGRPLIRSFQNLLRNTPVGKLFFQTVATKEAVRNILCQCYHDTSQVTEELVDSILLPGLEPGAADVFLEFICYSDGPLPEELLPQVKCPVLVVWGDKDPWEPIELGRAYGNFDLVEDFVALPNVGHCPQDEAPHLVNPLVESFAARHATVKS